MGIATLKHKFFRRRGLCRAVELTFSWHGSQSTRRHRGTAMTEMVLSLPLIFIVLSLLFFVGRGVVRVQRALMMDRYEAWRDAAHLQVSMPESIDQVMYWARYVSVSESLGPTLDNGFLSQVFEGPAASAVTGVGGMVGATSDAQETLLAEDNLSDDGRYLLDTFFAMQRQSVQATLKTQFQPDTTPLWSQMDRAVTHGHRRDDADWSASRGYHVIQVDFQLMQSQGFSVMELVDQNRLIHFVHSSGAEYFVRSSDQVPRQDTLDMWQQRNFSGIDPTRAMRDLYLQSLDQQLGALASSDSEGGSGNATETLAGAIMGLYLETGQHGSHMMSYVGPTVCWFNGYRWLSQNGDPRRY